MSCFFPKSCVKVYDPEFDQVRLKYFKPSNEISRKENSLIAERLTLFKFGEFQSYAEAIEVPCQKCYGCRLDYARGWAERIVLETLSYSHNYFVTFTFDNDHLGSNSLDKKGFSDYLKSLRELWRDKYHHIGIRFFMCGEYGKKNLRKHYHVIFFNMPFYDLVPWQTSSGVVYTSAILLNHWKRGFVSIGDVSFNSAGYVARYSMKKAGDFYLPDGRSSEFVNMSRKPGIARSWYEANKYRLYDRDGVYMKSSGKVSLVRPSPYFDRLFKDDDPDKMSDVKMNRRILALSNLTQKFSKTTLTLDEQRHLEYEDLVEKIRRLKRSIEC